MTRECDQTAGNAEAGERTVEVTAENIEEAVAFVCDFLGGDGEWDKGIDEVAARYLVEQVLVRLRHGKSATLVGQP